MDSLERIRKTKLKIAEEWLLSQKNGLDDKNLEFLSRFFLGDSKFIYFSDKLSGVDEQIAQELVHGVPKATVDLREKHPRVYQWATRVFWESQELKRKMPELKRTTEGASFGFIISPSI